MSHSRLLLCAFLGLVGTACSATTEHTVTVAPVSGPTPVSMSGFYYNSAGKLVTPDDYRVVGKLQHSPPLVAPINETTHQTINISEVVAQEVARTKGDAIVNVTAQAEKYHGGSTGALPAMRTMGTVWTIVGAAFVGTGIALSQTDSDMPAAVPLICGGVLGGAGITLLIVQGSIAGSSKSTWKISVEGDVVQQLPQK